MNITEDLASWASLVGIGLPALVALLQRTHWSSTTNALVYGAGVVVASVVYGWIKFGHDFTWARWEGSLLAIVVWGTATYHAYWAKAKEGQPSIADKLRAVPLGILPEPTPKGKR